MLTFCVSLDTINSLTERQPVHFCNYPWNIQQVQSSTRQ